VTADELETLKTEVQRLRQDLDELLGHGDLGDPKNKQIYRPIPAPRWWLLRGEARAEAVARLEAWVRVVYRPMYGHLAAKLPACWAQHPLCLVCLDWLSELHSVLYIQPTRKVAELGAQAEWHARFLPAVADMMTAETRACEHAGCARVGAFDITALRGARS
jgi:hypothetical protein